MTTLEESEYKIIDRVGKLQFLLQDKFGGIELWEIANSYSDHLIEIDGISYEFKRTIKFPLKGAFLKV